MNAIFAGDTSDVWELGFVVSDEGAALELAELDPAWGWACSLAVRGPAGNALSRAVTTHNEAGNRFLAWLTPAETALLGPGLWTVAIELRNPDLSPPFAREVHRRVRIRPGVIPA